MSEFWRELFQIQGTMLANSSAYHPQTEGQTEVLNHCLEDYLRSFIPDNPQEWTWYLPWAKWHYNTMWYSANKMPPFDAVFGCSPPSLADYVIGDSSVASVDELLVDRAIILKDLKNNLLKARQWMRDQANSVRTDSQLQVNDSVLLKLQQYKQMSLLRRSSNKLAWRFFGPF